MILAALLALSQPEINPAFILPGSEAEALFVQGFKDANGTRDDERLIDKYRRGIGDVRKNVLGSKETVSYVWTYPPKLIAYHAGYMSRKKFEPDEKVVSFENTLLKGLFDPMKQLHFYGRIRLLPSRGGAYGQLTRLSNPRDLEDVRVVLKVGDHIYQPLHQPGYMLDSSGHSSNEFTTPSTAVSHFQGVVDNRRGREVGSFEGTEETFYHITHEQNYRWYQGDFNVWFDLLESDGSPRITASDSSFEVIVVYGTNERHAKYDLKEFKEF